jgi:hypothetical protein
MPADPETVYDWLKALGVLTASATSEAVADNKLHAYAPLLADEFDQACFCRSSLAFVARGAKFFPTFGEVCDLLVKWWRSQRPYTGLALSGPADPWDAKVRAERAEAGSDWSDPVVIQASVTALDGNPLRPTLGRILAVAVAFHAPHLIELVPAEFRPLTPDEGGKVIDFPEAAD